MAGTVEQVELEAAVELAGPAELELSTPAPREMEETEGKAVMVALVVPEAAGVAVPRSASCTQAPRPLRPATPSQSGLVEPAGPAETPGPMALLQRFRTRVPEGSNGSRVMVRNAAESNLGGVSVSSDISKSSFPTHALLTLTRVASKCILTRAAYVRRPPRIRCSSRRKTDIDHYVRP